MRQKYKILHIETGLYVNYPNPNSVYITYILSNTPYIFSYKVPYFSMFDRRLNKIIKGNLIFYLHKDGAIYSEFGIEDLKMKFNKHENKTFYTMSYFYTEKIPASLIEFEPLEYKIHD